MGGTRDERRVPLIVDIPKTSLPKESRQVCIHFFKKPLTLNRIGILVALILSLSGCDYWPPALHHEMEELRSHLNDVLDERQQLNNDIAELRSLQASLQREVEEKEHENEELRSHLAQLTDDRIEQDTPTPQPTPSSKRSPQPTVMKGGYVLLQPQTPPIKGPRVARVQRLLRQQGFPIRVDAVYGRDTVSAVRGFQRHHGLVEDGAIGPQTERALRRSTNAPTLARQLRLQRPPLKGQDVKLVQRALSRAGHRLIADGRFGPETKIAIARFQKKHGLRPDGIVGPTTWNTLVRPRR